MNYKWIYQPITHEQTEISRRLAKELDISVQMVKEHFATGLDHFYKHMP